MTHRSKQQDERRQAEYWKQRALEAEAKLRELERHDRATLNGQLADGPIFNNRGLRFK